MARDGSLSICFQTVNPPMASTATVAAATTTGEVVGVLDLGGGGCGGGRSLHRLRGRGRRDVLVGGVVLRCREGRQWADGRDLGEHLGPERGRRSGLGQHRQLRRRGDEALDLGLAGGAAGEVALEARSLDVVEGVHGVGTRECVDVFAHSVTPNVSRSLISPSRMRVLAVPSGRSSMVATSVWVYPER